MDAKKAKPIIRASILGLMGPTASDMEAILQDSRQVIPLGVENDADAMLVVFMHRGYPKVYLAVGTSIRLGTKLFDYLVAYHDNDKSWVERFATTQSEAFAADIAKYGRGELMLRDGDDKLRSFRNIKVVYDTDLN